MILGPISYLDCIAFCILLAPQLLWQVGPVGTVFCVLQALPFLLIKLPIAFLHERYIIPREKQSPFVQKASPFEDVVIRCVRYAFANIPPAIGRVFFSKPVTLPFLRFRMIRHGYLRCPFSWTEHRERSFRGIWIVKDPMKKPDFVLYYAHGGGFSMGSVHFYLEFLLAWMSILVESGYSNPAIFALEYTLVPDASYPTQLHETMSAYEHVLGVAGDPSIVCVSGDSAGATLILSLLLHLASKEPNTVNNGTHLRKPALAVLISPWTNLVSARHKHTRSDYLNVQQLHRYGSQYVGAMISECSPLVSPGCCKDLSWWKRSSPSKGFYITYGGEEVLGPEIKLLAENLREADVIVGSKSEPGGIHAWPVASLFLSSTREGRLGGLKTITQEIRERIP
ncbi:Alpha/Beta hydrolase protein [Bombardia bombarda]|uniref:Alpha/Beta hydrolase protein n=1 Tax=Bombardia bombarda TaxID=252184 RepID=A0AA39WTA3_9PEZI|nr:Alpha/Beta hydrolase protein [Bombardia bombarda]